MTVNPVVRPLYGGPEDPEGAGATIYEIIISMKLKSMEGRPDNNMNAAFSYFWSSDRDIWVPYRLRSYTDRGGMFFTYAY